MPAAETRHVSRVTIHLGGPITIQPDTASKDPHFMAQLSEDFDLDLGDAGLLYSYTDCALWDCH